MQNICFDMSIIQVYYTCISVCANKLELRRTKLHPKAVFFPEVIIQTYCHFSSSYNGRKAILFQWNFRKVLIQEGHTYF